MTTAYDIITRALRSINVLGVGETPDAATAQDALDSLNDVLEGWANETLMVYSSTTESFPLLAGVGTYTMGPSGDFDTTRPTTINDAWVRWNDVDYPLQILTQREYSEIPLKSTLTNIPSAIYVNTGFPQNTVYLWCVPNVSGNSIFFNTLKPFTSFTSLTDTVNFPPGYSKAMRYALAVEMMPEYGVNNGLVIEMANEAKAKLKRTNFSPVIMALSDALPRHNTNYNIYADN